MVYFFRGKEKTVLKQVSFPFPEPLYFLQKLLSTDFIFLLTQKYKIRKINLYILNIQPQIFQNIFPLSDFAKQETKVAQEFFENDEGGQGEKKKAFLQKSFSLLPLHIANIIQQADFCR